MSSIAVCRFGDRNIWAYDLALSILLAESDLHLAFDRLRSQLS